MDVAGGAIGLHYYYFIQQRLSFVRCAGYSQAAPRLVFWFSSKDMYLRGKNPGQGAECLRRSEYYG